MGNVVIFRTYSSNCIKLEIGNTEYTFKPGEILLRLLYLPQPLIDDLLSESAQMLSQWDKSSIEINISVFKELFEALENKCLQNLFLLIPAAPILYSLKNEYVQATLSEFTSDEFHLHDTRFKRVNSILKNMSETSKKP